MRSIHTLHNQSHSILLVAFFHRRLNVSSLTHDKVTTRRGQATCVEAPYGEGPGVCCFQGNYRLAGKQEYQQPVVWCDWWPSNVCCWRHAPFLVARHSPRAAPLDLPTRKHLHWFCSCRILSLYVLLSKGLFLTPLIFPGGFVLGKSFSLLLRPCNLTTRYPDKPPPAIIALNPHQFSNRAALRRVNKSLSRTGLIMTVSISI